MNKVMYALAAAVIASIGFTAFTPVNKKVAAVSYNVLTDFSKVEFVGTKKSGYHSGAFKVKSGDVKLDGNKLVGGKFVIDLASVKSDDAKLDQHLKAGDFFDVAANNGEATFEITGVQYSGETDAKISGTLTLKGVSVPVSFPAVIRNADDKRFFAQAFFSIDRTLWGINYGIGNVAKDVQISVYLFANK